MTIDRDEVKAAMKEAMREWLNEKFLEFGKWSAKGLAAAGLVALIYLILITHGWDLNKK
jgi:hypothetical protein